MLNKKTSTIGNCVLSSFLCSFKCAVPLLFCLCGLTGHADSDLIDNDRQIDPMTLEDIHKSHPRSLKIDERVYRYIAFDIFDDRLDFADMCEGLHMNEIDFHDLITKGLLRKIFAMNEAPEGYRVVLFENICFMSNDQLVSLEKCIFFYSHQSGKRICYAIRDARWNRDKTSKVSIDKLKTHEGNGYGGLGAIWSGSLIREETETGIFWYSYTGYTGKSPERRHAVKARFSPYGALESAAATIRKDNPAS